MLDVRVRAQDIEGEALAEPVLEHRLAMRPEAQMRGETVTDLIKDILGRLRVPGTTSRIAT